MEIDRTGIGERAVFGNAVRPAKQQQCAFVGRHLFYANALGQSSYGVLSRGQKQMTLRSIGKEIANEGKIVGIIEDEQAVRVLFEPAMHFDDRRLLFPGLSRRQIEDVGDGNKAGEKLLPRIGIDPEERLVFLAVAVGIFQRGLRLAHTAKAAESRNAWALECGAKVGQDLIAASKEGGLARGQIGERLKFLFALQLRLRRQARRAMTWTLPTGDGVMSGCSVSRR